MLCLVVTTFSILKEVSEAVKILKFIFLNHKMNSNGQMIKTKIIDRDESYNFVVDKLSISNHFRCQNYDWNFHILKFKILNCSNELGWRNGQNKNCRS
jgi:hypothetical protein